VAVWAEEQLVVADEFRDGNVAGGEDPLSSARRAFENLPVWVRQRYFRGDSASYCTPLLHTGNCGAYTDGLGEHTRSSREGSRRASAQLRW